MGVVKGVLNISSNAASVFRSIKKEQSSFKKDVEATSKALTKTWDKKWTAKVETSAASQKIKSLSKSMEPLRKKVVTAMAVKDAASKKVQSVTNKVKAVGKLVAKPLVAIKDATAAGLSKIKSGLKSVTKAVAIPVGIAATAVLAGSFSQGAKLEQSIGGVDTLFKNDSAVVQANADMAFQTAGLSANEYMETVTSFSASLLQSLGGDTAVAAAKADMAIIDMADNANKFGTDMESIQNAYQGFAKQNYTMLDNLKLGYGGTKEEMNRLLGDATKLSGVEYSIDSLSDVYDAIHVIQEDLGVTGTTAQEASETFSGSFASMKAAAQNLLGNLAIGGDVTGSMEKLVDSASTFLFDNAIPMLGRIVSALPGAIKTGIAKAAPKIMEAGGSIISSLKDGMIEMLPSAIGGPLSEMLGSFSVFGPAIESVKTTFSDLMPVVATVFGSICSVISQATPFISGVIQVISGAISTLAPVVSTIFGGIASTIGSVASFLGGKMGFLKSAFGSAFSGIANVLTTAWSIVGPVLKVMVSVFKLLFNVVQAVFPVIKSIIGGVWDFLKPIFEGLGSALSAVAEGVGWLAEKIGGFLGLDSGEEVASVFSDAAPASSEVEPSAAVQAAETAAGSAEQSAFSSADGPSGTDEDPVNIDFDGGDFDWPDDPSWPDDGGGYPTPTGSMAMAPVASDMGATPASVTGQPVEQHIDQSVSVQIAQLAGAITIKEEVDIDGVAARVVDTVVAAIQNTQAVPSPA